MSKDIKKALEHCVEWNCDNCPNREELGSGEIVCRGRLLPEVLEYVADLEAKLAEKDKEIKQLKQQLRNLPKKIVEDFYDEIRHRAILEDDYCPDHNLERTYGVRKCLLEDIITTILKKYGYVKLKAEPCDKEQQIAIYKRALELAVREIVYDCGSWKLTIEDEMQDYLDQAKKELEEQDVTNN